KALETIVKTAGYVAVREDADIIRIVPPSSLRAQLSIQVYPLNYLRPPDEYKAVLPSRPAGGSGQGVQQNSEGIFKSMLSNSPKADLISDFTLLTSLKKMAD